VVSAFVAQGSLSSRKAGQGRRFGSGPYFNNQQKDIMPSGAGILAG